MVEMKKIENNNNKNENCFDVGPPPSYETLLEKKSQNIVYLKNNNTLVKIDNNIDEPIYRVINPDSIETSKNSRHIPQNYQPQGYSSHSSNRDHYHLTSEQEADNLNSEYDLILRHDDYIKNDIEKNYPHRYVLRRAILISINQLVL